MTETASRDLIVLPPVADDPIFAEELFGEFVPDLEILTEANAELPKRPGSDPHDFAALFMRHRWSFALHARRFLHDERDVDEVVQEGFLRLFLALPELETELQVLAYCRSTITNLCIDRYRADQRRPRLLDLEALPVDLLTEDDDVDPIVQAEDAAIVRQALAMLSPLHREALIKREVEEKSLPQIADELDITVEQTKHLLFRARRSLRRLLIGTHVEPGVDLDVATVLAANRARAARAAKPTGAAVLALLLVLAGVLGLRSGGSRPSSVADGPSSGALRQLFGPPAGRQAAPARVPARSVAPGPAATAPRGRRTFTSRLPRAASAAPAITSGPAAGTPTGSPVGPKTPIAVVPQSQRSFSVSGVGGSGVAQVSDQQRSLQGAGTTSSSTISAVTLNGTYALRQAFTFAPDGSLAGVVLNESVPLADGGAVGTLVSSTSSSVETQADGSLHVVSSGTAAPLAAVDGQAVAPRALTVDVVLAPDRVQVVTERVLVADGGLVVASASPFGSPHAAAAPDAGTATSAPSGTVPATPSTPLPSTDAVPALPPAVMAPTSSTGPVVDPNPPTG